MLPSADASGEQKCDQMSFTLLVHGILLLLLPWLLIVNNALAYMMDVYFLLYMSPSSPHSFTISSRVSHMSNILLKVSFCFSGVFIHHFVGGQVLDFCKARIETSLTVSDAITQTELNWNSRSWRESRKQHIVQEIRGIVRGESLLL